MRSGLKLPQIAPYLLEHNLIDAASIVHGDLTVEDVSGRNRNYKVKLHGAGLMLKQGVGIEGIEAIAHEAEVYQVLGSCAGFGRYLPSLHAYHHDQNLLVLELVPDSRNLREYYGERGHFSLTLSRTLGRALGRLHDGTTAAELRDHQAPSFDEDPPWILSIHRPRYEVLRNISGAQVWLLKTIQRHPEVGALLDELRADWRLDALIHHDIRWDNCVVYCAPGSRRTTRLAIVDWELSSIGDPSWDVGTVFSDFLACWLLSIPITGDAPLEEFPALAGQPLDRMQPAVQAFWNAYIRERGFDSATSVETLLSAVRFAGARLIQTAFEQMRISAKPTATVTYFLQLSANIMQRPHEASVHLLGLVPQ